MEKWKQELKEVIWGLDAEKMFPLTKAILDVEPPGIDQHRIRLHKRASRQETYDLRTGKYRVQRRPLPDEYKSVLELSCRCTECPLPMNMDVYTGGYCFGCVYCYALYFDQSLYSAFYDDYNPATNRATSLGTIRKTLRDLMRGKGKGAVQEAVRRRIPIRLGIRTEDFLPIEKTKQRALEVMRILHDYDYPMMINTKSDLLLKEPYLSRLVAMADNFAMQVSIIHADDKVAKKLEMFAPSSTRRFEVVKTLNEMGVRCMPRIEPCAGGLNADWDHLRKYARLCAEAGAPHVTSDTYSYSAHSVGIRANFYAIGIDYDRMFQLSSVTQVLGAVFLMRNWFLLEEQGVGNSTFDFHTAPLNSMDVCCGVDDKILKGADFNNYNILTFSRELIRRGKMGLGEMKKKYKPLPEVMTFAGESKKAGTIVDEMWNKKHLSPWAVDWTAGVRPVGTDEYGLVYEFSEKRAVDRFKRLRDVIEEWYK